MSYYRKTFVAALAETLIAIENCRKSGNTIWAERHGVYRDHLLSQLPSGSGIDGGTTLLAFDATARRFAFQADFHHMDEQGMYDGWTQHQIIVTPDWDDTVAIRITGRDRNGIKEHLHEIFHLTLTAVMPPRHEREAKLRLEVAEIQLREAHRLLEEWTHA